MDTQKLFRLVVVGGSVLAGGCGSKSTQAAPAHSGQATAATTSAEDVSGTKAASPVNEESPEVTEPPPAAEVPAPEPEALDCAEICDVEGDLICPDASMDGAMGCCWLMTEPHPCCDWVPPEDE